MIALPLLSIMMTYASHNAEGNYINRILCQDDYIKNEFKFIPERPTSLAAPLFSRLFHLFPILPNFHLVLRFESFTAIYIQFTSRRYSSNIMLPLSKDIFKYTKLALFHNKDTHEFIRRHLGDRL